VEKANNNHCNFLTGHYWVYITTFRAFRLSRGILHLCQQGYADISLILYRSLLELRITLAYIEQDRENRTELFLDHYFIWEKWWMDSKTQGGRSVPGQERKEIMKEYNRVKAKYPNKYWWAGKNIEQIAKEAKVDTNIRNWYGYLSTHVHSCAHILDKFVRNNEIFFPSSIAPSIEYYDSALSSTIISFKSLMEKCLSVLGLSIPPDLQQVFNDIDKELKSCP